METQADSDGEVLDRVEAYLLARRSFLAGLGLGGLGGVGAALGLERSDGGLQSVATLASGAAVPARTRYYLPAVDAAAGGLVVPVEFTFSRGSGELFVNLNGIEVRHDLQLALREARETAAGLTGRSLETVATRVTFEPPDSGVTALRGKSWEAGLTVALVASLRPQPLSRETLITGVVDEGGTLLPVGGIETKARVARAFGATELIVPESESTKVSVQGIQIDRVRSISSAVDRIL